MLVDHDIFEHFGSVPLVVILGAPFFGEDLVDDKSRPLLTRSLAKDKIGGIRADLFVASPGEDVVIPVIVQVPKRRNRLFDPGKNLDLPTRDLAYENILLR